MQSCTVPDNWYGPGTDRIRCILFQVQGIRWFSSVPGDNQRDQLVTLVERHLESLSGFDHRIAKPAVPKLALLEGHWSVLHQNLWGIDPYIPWGDRWQAAEQQLGRVVQRLRGVVDANPDARLLLRRPLWPVEGISNICGLLIIADLNLPNPACHLPSGGRDRCVAWALLCKAQDYAYDALLWELAAGVGAVRGPNPFQFLLDMYELGAFPMGWADDHYEIYVPTIPTCS